MLFIKTKVSRPLEDERSGRDCMAVGFTTTLAISSYLYLSCEFESSSRRGVFDTPSPDKVCQ
jgi:hypothetical protein